MATLNQILLGIYPAFVFGGTLALIREAHYAKQRAVQIWAYAVVAVVFGYFALIRALEVLGLVTFGQLIDLLEPMRMPGYGATSYIIWQQVRFLRSRGAFLTERARLTKLINEEGLE